MTGTSGFLAGERGWRVVLAGAVAVLVAAVVALFVRTGDPATADTYLADVQAAVVVAADGSTAPATEGMRVPVGASVRTGQAGHATLTTAGRDVYLLPGSVVAVRDGVHQRLDDGQVVVDSRNGPHLTLGTRAGDVAVDDHAVARVEQGVVLRLGVFTGHARLTAANRRVDTDVPALHQTKAEYGGLGRTPTALALTDDAWERRVAADLVAADLDLRALGRGLAGPDGVAVVQSVSTQVRAVLPATLDRGEQALSVAVAQASADSDKAGALAEVQSDRASGGSWGVVAALVRARVSAVSQYLDDVLAPPATVPGGGTQAGGTPDLSGLLGGGTSGGTSGGTTGGPRVTRSPSSGPTVTATPTIPPVTATPTVVDSLVTTVTGLLSPTPKPPSVHLSPTPSPTPLLQIGPIHIG